MNFSDSDDHGDDAYCDKCGKWYPVTIGPPGHLCPAASNKPMAKLKNACIGVLGTNSFLAPNYQTGEWKLQAKPYWWPSKSEAELNADLAGDYYDGLCVIEETTKGGFKHAKPPKQMPKLPQVSGGPAGRTGVADKPDSYDSVYDLWKQTVSKSYRS